MNGKMKKTSISSVVCLDIIDFSKKSKAEQQQIKKQLHTLINQAVLDIPEKDCLVVDTEHGATITCSGPLESALEDVLFIALTIRDEVLNSNVGSETPLYLLMGINLGSVRLEKNSKSDQPPKIIGEGLEEAQRIMSFANPNQILVSRAYYDMASKLTLEVAQMFEKYDMHAYEDDIYAVRRLNEKSTVENAAAALDHIEKPQEGLPEKQSKSWHVYALPVLLALIMLAVLFKWMKHDEANTQAPPSVKDSAVEDSIEHIDTLPDPLPEILPEAETQEEITPNPTQDKPKAVKEKAKTNTKPKAKKKPVSKAKTEETGLGSQEVGEAEVETTTVESHQGEEKSTWDSIKDSVKSGAESECTQAQKALNQCE